MMQPKGHANGHKQALPALGNQVVIKQAAKDSYHDMFEKFFTTRNIKNINNPGSKFGSKNSSLNSNITKGAPEPKITQH